MPSVIVALAGNPNVGKSTVFNGLTGLRQHTGNWPGKTVENARGTYAYKGRSFELVDVPGTYSLSAHSQEEEVARDFICFGAPDVTVVVCDATCLERNLHLALGIQSATGRCILCLNLMDEARRRHIDVDARALSEELGMPVVPMEARNGKGLEALRAAIDKAVQAPRDFAYPTTCYPDPIEREANRLEQALGCLPPAIGRRWAALTLLGGDPALCARVLELGAPDEQERSALEAYAAQAQEALAREGYTAQNVRERIITCDYKEAARIATACVTQRDGWAARRQGRVDRLLTGRVSGMLTMLMLLMLVFYITIVGANVPSQLLADALFRVQDMLTAAFLAVGAPDWLHGALVLGVYRVLAWVVSVMLPPMAIFFPLFTLLEDLGYLPRMAFNMDRCFARCGACGKQALTTAMGFGCNAVGVMGCRIIDSPRERLIAILTNSFVPCNGRFPLMVTLITLFFAGSAVMHSAMSALALTLVILLGVGMTLAMARFLSKTLLRGVPSAFTLEMPPFRVPQVGRVIVRSVLDRTIFVLGRAVAVAAPAGLLIYALSMLAPGGESMLTHLTRLLDPLGRLMGMDGVILLAFILGFPANEIVLPLAVMVYTASGVLAETDTFALGVLLRDNGWTAVTALCTIVFSLLHWPCSTTLITIYKETGSKKWTALGALLPTACGAALCMLIHFMARLLGVLA